MADILNTAQHLIDNDRQKAYGDPVVMWQRVAKVWSVIFKTDISPEQALLAMCALKAVRQSVRHSDDNLVDMAAYAELIARIRDFKDAKTD